MKQKATFKLKNVKRSTQAIDISENLTETKKKNTEYPNYLKNKFITEMFGHYLPA